MYTLAYYNSHCRFTSQRMVKSAGRCDGPRCVLSRTRHSRLAICSGLTRPKRSIGCGGRNVQLQLPRYSMGCTGLWAWYGVAFCCQRYVSISCAFVGRMARAHLPRRQIAASRPGTLNPPRDQRPVPHPPLTHLPSNPRIPLEQCG